MKKTLLFLMLLFAYISVASASDAILIYGGKNKDVFLGCINCSKYDDSSIWNKYGSYGDKYSDTSPYNKYASYPPVLVDYDGGFYGYLTVNTYNNPSNSSIAKYILLNYDSIRDNISETYELLFTNSTIYTSSSYNNLTSVTCGKNSSPNSDNKCSCISGYEWEYPSLSNNYDCKPKITADQACILSYGIYSVSTGGDNCNCMTGYQWSLDRKSCIKKQVITCGKNSSPSEAGKCSCNTGYIWEYPDISNNYDCKVQPTICPDTVNGYLGVDNKCYCKTGYSFDALSNSCKKIVTSVLKCKKGELIRNKKCVSTKLLK